jgi:hypothetical protein
MESPRAHRPVAERAFRSRPPAREGQQRLHRKVEKQQGQEALQREVREQVNGEAFARKELELQSGAEEEDADAESEIDRWAPDRNNKAESA